MALSLANDEKIAIKRRYTVRGFVHRMQKAFQIPTPIIYLITLFYGDIDQWDEELLSTCGLKFDQEEQVVTNISDLTNNVYTKDVVRADIMYWMYFDLHQSLQIQLSVWWLISKD